MAHLTMLIGLPGAGKSKFANGQKEHFGNTVVLSSDAIRKELYGDEQIQDNPSKVFDTMNKRTIECLKCGKNVIYDATNLRRKNRKHLLKQVPKDCTKVAIIVWAKYETCVKRDEERDRHVGVDVIRKMIKNFQPPFYDEGWDVISIFMSDSAYTKKDYENWLDCDHDNPHHNNTILEHTNKVVSEALRLPACRHHNEILLAAKLHDIGKKFTKGFINAKGEITPIAHFYDHQNVGSYFAIGYEELQGLSLKMEIFVVWLINSHMEPFFDSKYYKSLPTTLKNPIDLLHHCDIAGA